MITLIMVVAIIWLFGTLGLTYAWLKEGTPMTLPMTFLTALKWPWLVFKAVTGKE